MSLADALGRCFAAWDDHGPDAVVRSLADGGSYQDSAAGGPLTGDALAANVATLLAGFPDLHFDLVSVAPAGDTAAAALWLMRGTSTGPMPPARRLSPDRGEFGMASISERENREIEAANASGNTPVVFIHGLWLLPSSWANWADLFGQAGYAPLTLDWPDDPETVEQARANPHVLARKTLKQIADHTTEIINALDKKPAVMGHSTGGLLAQMLAGRGLSAVTVAIDPGIFRGVLPLPASALKVAGPFLVNPLTRGRAITLTFGQFQYGWVNALDEKEAKELYDTFHVAGSGISLMQMGNANLNPRTEAKVNTMNPGRGPLLIIDGEKDHTVPWAIANAAYKRQRRNPAVTEIVKIPNRGHSLTIDHGWREVAQTALDFVNRFA